MLRGQIGATDDAPESPDVFLAQRHLEIFSHVELAGVAHDPIAGANGDHTESEGNQDEAQRRDCFKLSAGIQ